MNNVFKFLVVFLVLGFSIEVLAEEICGTDEGSGFSFKYCIYTSNESTDIMYYMHGANGSEKNWMKFDPYVKVRENWKKSGKALPNVIAVSFGDQWLLTDMPKKGGVSLYQAFVDYVMPLMESKVTNKGGRRLIMGESMGGLNSAFLYLRHGYLFDRAALNCPAIVSFGPHAESSEVDAYVQRHKSYINRIYVKYIQDWGKEEFPTVSDWERNAPLGLAKVLPRSSPSLYVSCGTRDQFGFIEGAFLLADQARNLGINTTWMPLEKGGHCTINSQSLAEFLRP
ncbi:MAG: alpha/beta hydrolase-fold protein [Pseudomonadota bacterium]|nr:alpha/beta hydrolase-fold protein [Pseudomonadota bacterium]